MVTRVGVVMGADQATQTEPPRLAQLQVRPATQKNAPLDVEEKKHIFMDVFPNFIGMEQPSTSGQVKYMLERFQKIFEQQTANKSADKVSKLKPFLSSCLTLIQDKVALAELEALIETLSKEYPPTNKVNSVKTKFKTGCELNMSVKIGDYDMDYIILELGSDVNILTCQTWEIMSKPPLEWSPIQLRLSN